jgi:hypothetical protein
VIQPEGKPAQADEAQASALSDEVFLTGDAGGNMGCYFNRPGYQKVHVAQVRWRLESEEPASL